MHLTRKVREGFTLVELLVVIAIIGTLVALLLPALSSARAASNASASANNLSTFGRGFELYASSHDGSYSSGAFDHFRDGDVRQYGWVADLIGTKVANPGKGLDPAHLSKISETVGDYTGAFTGNQGNIASGTAAGRWPAGTTGASVSGSTYFTTNGAASTRDVWNEGYNSNYVTTWHFSRGDPAVTTSNTTGFNLAGAKGPTDGDGPLSQNIVSQASTTAARIALMAPARPVSGASGLIDSAAVTTLKTFTGTPIAKQNDRMTTSLTNGMVISGSGANAGSTFVHDLQGIFPLHQAAAGGVGGHAPVLFADLHVEKLVDTAKQGNAKQGDGYIGNLGSALDADMYQEASEKIWMKRLRAVPE